MKTIATLTAAVAAICLASCAGPTPAPSASVEFSDRNGFTAAYAGPKAGEVAEARARAIAGTGCYACVAINRRPGHAKLAIHREPSDEPILLN